MESFSAIVKLLTIIRAAYNPMLFVRLLVRLFICSTQIETQHENKIHKNARRGK
ncbi:hypothetical protein S2091_1063 [Solimicrobium silvestre]|uniref:Uncharacterized protein n=1 Tax=Solimicrobium silvestre TaxID=2099400 RepID=A0A2S9H382_9BURK|nr:hypothetical protein S2091_1063 [Solimicrobium silvestre]